MLDFHPFSLTLGMGGVVRICCGYEYPGRSRKYSVINISQEGDIHEV